MDSRLPTPKTLEMARERLDRALMAQPHSVRLLVLRARADERCGNHAEAAGFFERAAMAARRGRNHAQEASALLDCGVALSRAGYDQEAVSAYQRAIEGFAALGNPASVDEARMALARHQLAHRRMAEARREIEGCLESLEARGAWPELGWALDRLVEVTRREEPEVALRHAREAVRVGALARDPVSFGLRLAAFGRLHLKAGHPSKARTYLSKALPYLREAQRLGPLLEALLGLVELHELAGEREGSRALLEEALEVVDLGAPVQKQGRVRLMLADRLVAADPSRARALLAEAVVLFREAGDPRSSAPAWLKLATLQHELGDVAEARQSQTRARELFAMIGDDVGVAKAALPFELLG